MYAETKMAKVRGSVVDKQNEFIIASSFCLRIFYLEHPNGVPYETEQITWASEELMLNRMSG